MNEDNCTHIWISNSGTGGQPEFRRNRMLSTLPIMHVRCSECNARTWFTDEQWTHLKAASAAMLHKDK